MGWQYQTIASNKGQSNVNGTTVGVNEMLNAMGAQNWELVAIVTMVPGVYEFVFKQPA
jgi:hypothetical protein